MATGNNFNFPTYKTINDFKALLNGGGARTNLFEVEISFPLLAPIAGVNDVIREARFMAKATAMPAMNITPIPVAFRGRKLPVAGERIIEPWSMTVVNDNDYLVRNAFERWSNFINNVMSDRGEMDPNNYTSDMKLYLLDRNGDTTRYYHLQSCWPSNVSRQDLSFDTEAVQEFTVDVQMLNFEIRPGNSPFTANLEGQDVVSDLE